MAMYDAFTFSCACIITMLVAPVIFNAFFKWKDNHHA